MSHPDVLHLGALGLQPGGRILQPFFEVVDLLLPLLELLHDARVVQRDALQPGLSICDPVLQLIRIIRQGFKLGSPFGSLRTNCLRFCLCPPASCTAPITFISLGNVFP